MRATRSVARLPDSSGSFSEVLGPSGRWADTGARAGSDGGRWCRAPMVVSTGIWACYAAVSWADTRAVMGTRRGTRAGLVSCPREVHANAVGTCRGRP